MPPLSELRRSLPALCAGGAVLTAALAIIGTYPVYSGTFDEPPHVAAGMEYLDRGRYTYEPLHPPLARMAVALGPYLAGVRSTGAPTMWREGRNVLYQQGRYVRNLALARLGILPFFLLTALVVWTWGRRLAGDWGGAAATGLLATTPPVLAHAGLATLDLALAATVGAAALAFVLWVERPCRTRSLLLGVTTGAALVTKFSAAAFLPAAWAAIILLYFLKRPSTRTQAGLSPPRAAAWALGAAALTVWAVYRFSIGPVTAGVPVPAPELWRGLGEVLDHREAGWEGYLLGDISTTGWWYFFPVALAVKTPLPFLALVLAGAALAWRAARRTGEWMILAPAAAAATILVAGMRLAPSIGLRQILPVYPLAAVVAGYGAVQLARRRPAPWPAALVGALCLWQVADAVRARPDFLPWFNAAAGRHPERVLVGSDLDWGQDLFRLVDTVRARGIDSLALAYFGTADPEMHFAHVRPLSPGERPAGWAAVSVAVIKGLAVPGRTGFAWLDTVPPTARIGASIRLYHFPSPERLP